jgi:hypothetical protein
MARLRPVKISAAPDRVDDLLRFLREMGYVVEEVDYGVVAVERGSVKGVLALRLARDIRVWNAVNKTDARIVPVSEPREP